MHLQGSSLLRSQAAAVGGIGKCDQYTGQTDLNGNSSFSVILRSNEAVGSTVGAQLADISLHRYTPNSSNRSLINMAPLRSNEGI